MILNVFREELQPEFDDWGEVKTALTDEINAARERKKEISLFDGKRAKEEEEGTNYYYQFNLSKDEYIDPNNIIEIRYKDKVIEDASLVKIKNKKAIVAIPKATIGIPKKIPVLILVNDPSFILQKLLEAIISIEGDQGFIDTIFGTQKDMFSPIEESTGSLNSSFPYNSQQTDAIEKSVRNKVLFIWGPPGTGKTTVLGKIISDYVKAGETVLLCSNTNRAVDVSILKALEVSDYEATPIKEQSLRWGNVFLTEEKDLQYVTLGNHILRRRKQKESKIQNEVDLLDDYKNAVKNRNEIEIKAKPYFLAKRRLDELSGKDELNDHQKEVKKRLKKQLKDLQKGIGTIEDNIKYLNQQIDEIEIRIKEDFESVGQLRDFVFNETLVTIGEILQDIKFHAATFARTVISEALQTRQFDNVLIDEASMANLPYILYLCTLARKRIIFVGDPQQLAPIVLSNGEYSDKWLKKDIFLKIASVNNVNDLFEWQKNNMDISTLLTDQYRMPLKIFNIVNDLFYRGRLVNKTKTSGSIKVIDTSELNPLLTFPSQKVKSPVNVNHSELLIDDISKSLASIDDKEDAAQSIGVMTPFTQHRRFIQYLSQIRYIPNTLEVGVVHTFQGREKQKIYFDLTLSNIDFTFPTFDEYKTSETDVSRLLNVALSRCKSSKLDYFDGEFVLLANIGYFKTHHSNGIVLKFINALVENADNVVTVTDPLNPLKLVIEDEEQLDIFEQVAKEEEDQAVVELKTKEVSHGPRIIKEIEKNCKIITKKIQLINYYGNEINGNDVFNYTSVINEVLAMLPVTYCEDKNTFKLFIDMMFKLIYESSKGKDATSPIWDRNAKYGKESYGKIRLVIHQLRNFYFHDYGNWEKHAQDKLRIHVDEFFKITIGKDEPDDDNEWLNSQLAILFKTTEYLKEVANRYKRKMG